MKILVVFWEKMLGTNFLFLIHEMVNKLSICLLIKVIDLELGRRSGLNYDAASKNHKTEEVSFNCFLLITISITTKSGICLICRFSVELSENY